MALESAVILDLSRLGTADLLGAGPAIALVQSSLSRGRHVIAVVAPDAQHEARDASSAARLSASASPADRAAIVASGPIDAAGAFARVLAEAGIPAVEADTTLYPRTRGHALDAEPRLVSAGAYTRALAGSTVVVVPGGVGLDEEGSVTSLGAGTATLTAVFLADRLALPVERGTLEPLGKTDPCAMPDETLGERKARNSAERSGVTVRCARPLGDGARSIRVGILGEHPAADMVERWAGTLGAPIDTVRMDADPDAPAGWRAVRPDVLIDFTGTARDSYAAGSLALRSGGTLITANTALIAERGGGLSIAALIGGGTLRASGALSGCPALAPILELVSAWPGVARVQGTLSPAGDRVLDLRSSGMSAEEAERRAAEELGLDADAMARARSGADALESACAAAQLAFGVAPTVRAFPRGPEHVSDNDLARAANQGRRYRVIATVERLGEDIAVRVGPVPVRAYDELVSDEPGVTRAVVESRRGERKMAEGRLRHPGSVAAAVLRDLVEIGRVPSPVRVGVAEQTGLGVRLGATA